LERKFRLIYRTSATLADTNNLPLKELEWLNGRLTKQLKREKEAIEKANKQIGAKEWRKEY
jgi:hypothetical protein